MTHTIKEIEQGRARFAYECAEEGKNLGSNSSTEESSKEAKEYKSYVKKLPTLIKTNGLAAALAFAFSKGSKEGKLDKKLAWGLLYNHIEAWLLKDSKQLIAFKENGLKYQLVKVDSYTYRATTIEVLAFLSWLRRFSEGLI